MYLASILFRKHENKIKLTCRRSIQELTDAPLPIDRSSVQIIYLLFAEVHLCCCTVFSKTLMTDTHYSLYYYVQIFNHLVSQVDLN